MTTRRAVLGWLGAGAVGVDPAAAAQERAAAPAAPPPTGADLGSLYSFIQSQAPKGLPSLSFARPEFKDLRSWKRRARGKLLELLHYSPPPCAPEPELLAREDRGDHWRERITFRTTRDLRVPAFVLAPKSAARKPAPAIVALHDHGGFYFWGKEKLVALEGEHPVLTEFKRSYYAGRSVADELVRRGYVVIAIDMFYWGDRRMLLDDDPADWRTRPPDIPAARIAQFNQRSSQSEQLVGRTLYSAGTTWAGILYWDDIRTVDYLATRPDVDPKRIGCVGLSVGGLRSCHLAALDERIRAAVVVGWMTSFPAQLRRKVRNTIGHTKLVPGLYHYLDYPDVASLAAPRALLVINGRRDGLFETEGVQTSFDRLAACYGKAGAPEKLRTRWYDTPHLFNAEMQTEAWDWLARWV